jgi:hypothetical protein
MNTAFEWDAFISHASEDKQSIVTPLATELRKFGLEIWFDDFELRIGDSLRQSIDRGLVRSRFGIVVLSPAFLAKQWPQSELNGLFARQADGTKVILPIWHQISKAELLNHSPMLADMFAGNSNLGVPALARKLVEVIRPELLQAELLRERAS